MPQDEPTTITLSSEARFLRIAFWCFAGLGAASAIRAALIAFRPVQPVGDMQGMIVISTLLVLRPKAALLVVATLLRDTRFANIYDSFTGWPLALSSLSPGRCWCRHDNRIRSEAAMKTASNDPPSANNQDPVTLSYACPPKTAGPAPRLWLLFTALIIDGTQWTLLPVVYSNSLLSDEECLRLFIAYVLLAPGIAVIFFARASWRSWIITPLLLHAGWTALLTLRMLGTGFYRY